MITYQRVWYAVMWGQREMYWARQGMNYLPAPEAVLVRFCPTLLILAVKVSTPPPVIYSIK